MSNSTLGHTTDRNSDEKCSFEGFVIKVSGTTSDYQSTNAFNEFLTKAKNLVKSNLGQDWEVHQDEDDFDEFDLIPKESVILSATEYWDLFYKLKKDKGIDRVEAVYKTTLEKKASEELDPDDETVESAATVSRSSSSSDDSFDPVLDWHLKEVKAIKAWNKTKGEGIRIGHPDTGLIKHRELFQDGSTVPSPRLRLDIARDFISKDDDNPVRRAKIANHGLSTGSVITSYDNKRPKVRVHGVAPRAELVPMRVTNFQMLGGKGLRRIKQAIKHARNTGCNVVSISLGSPLLSLSLQNEAARAVNEGIILLAAAGNGLKWIQPPVVYPARYLEFIAVAASNDMHKPWKQSSRGPEVEVTAPGQAVWRARVIKGVDKVKPSSGTSYSVAIAAGVAALWLSHHGVKNLKEKYKRVENGQIVYDRVVYAFRRILNENSDSNRHLNPSLFGAGIINADKVLKAPLPDPSDVDTFKYELQKRHKGISDENTLSYFGVTFPAPKSESKTKSDKEPGLLWFNNIFSGENDDNKAPITNKQIKQILSTLLNVKVKNLSKILGVIGEELALQFMLSERLYTLFASSARDKKMRKKNIQEMRKALDKKDLSKTLRDKLS